MISAEKAADIIVNGIEKNKASISFPFPLNFGVWFLSAIPAGIADWIMGNSTTLAQVKRTNSTDYGE